MPWQVAQQVCAYSKPACGSAGSSAEATPDTATRTMPALSAVNRDFIARLRIRNTIIITERDRVRRFDAGQEFNLGDDQQDQRKALANLAAGAEHVAGLAAKPLQGDAAEDDGADDRA